MSLINIPYTFTVGAVIVASQHNSNFSTIYSDYNGNITDANISASAAITDTKLGQITTAGKVSGAALTSLSSVPSGAGALPIANGGTGQTTATASINALLPSQSTAGFVLKSDGTNTSFANSLSSVSDYTTSTGTSSAKQGTALKIAFGTTTSLSNGGTFVITNLPFTSSSSYYLVCSPVTNTTVQSAYATNNSASQCTITSMSVPAGSNVNCAYNWIAIGT